MSKPNNNIYNYKALLVNYNTPSNDSRMNKQYVNVLDSIKKYNSINVLETIIEETEPINPVTPCCAESVQSTILEEDDIEEINLASSENRTIYVGEEEHQMNLPKNFDVYEGLRRWYPELYNAVIEEEEMSHSLGDEDEEVNIHELNDEYECNYSNFEYQEFTWD